MNNTENNNINNGSTNNNSTNTNSNVNLNNMGQSNVNLNNMGQSNINYQNNNSGQVNNSNNVVQTTSSINANNTNNIAQTNNASNNNVVENGNVSTPNLGSNTNNNDDKGIINENLKKVEINYTPPSKAKTISMIIMLVFIILFVVFLPEITSMVNLYKASKNEEKKEIITTGKLECNLKTHTANLDIEYDRLFKYTDSKLESAEYVITTKGDIELDAESLNELNTKCNLLKENTKSMNGIDIKCTLTENKLIEKQNYKFANIVKEEIDSAFAEAGGTYPEYEAGFSIDEIERNMNAAGYTCVRKR